MTCSTVYRSQASAQYDDRWDLEHDDLMTAEDYDARQAQRDGWAADHWDGRW